MVSGQVPWKVEDGEPVGKLDAWNPTSAAAGVVEEELKLPRTVTVWVTVAAAAQVAAVVVATGSVQLSPVMENLGVWA